MPRYNMCVRRQIIETMRFTVEADSDVQAHEFAESDVRAGEYLGKEREEVVTVVTCHRERDKS